MPIMQPYIPEYKDRLGQALKTMQIIQSGYGIRTENEQQKLTKAKAEQEAMKTDEMAKEQRRRAQGLFNQAEKDALLTEGVGPSTPGATFGYVEEARVDPQTNQRLLNPDGTPQTQRNVFWYKPAGNIEGKAKESAASAAELRVKQDFARSKGIIPTEDLIDATKTSSYSFDKKPGWREGKTMIGGQEKQIWWVAPQDLAADNMKSDNTRADALAARQKNYYDAQDQLNKLKLQDAERIAEENQRIDNNKTILSDISSTKNATGLVPKQPPVPLVLAPEFLPESRNKPGLIPGKPGQPAMVYNEDPRKIEGDRKDISKRVIASDVVPVVTDLKNIDRVIGIDKRGPIPGIGSSRSTLKKIPFGVGDQFLNPKEQEIRTAIDNLVMRVRKMMSGANVTPSEAEVLNNALGTNLYSSPESLRNGLRAIRDVTRNQLLTIESGYSPESNAAFRSNKGSVHSDLPIFQTNSVEPTQTVDPNLTPESAMDDYFKGRK